MGFWIELLDEKSHTPSQREGEGEIEDRLHLGIKNEWDSFCTSLGLHYLCQLLISILLIFKHIEKWMI